MLASNSVGDTSSNSAVAEVQQLILHLIILQTSLYWRVKGGKHTHAHRLKPHADDIQAVQFEIRSSCILLKWSNAAQWASCSFRPLGWPCVARTELLGPVLHQGMVSAAFLWCYFQGPSLRLDSCNSAIQEIFLCKSRTEHKKGGRICFFAVSC